MRRGNKPGVAYRFLHPGSALILLAGLVSFLYMLNLELDLLHGRPASIPTSNLYSKRNVLVMYSLHTEDPEYMENFRFFIHEAMKDDTRCTYMVLVNKKDVKKVDLPRLPPHAYYVQHTITCGDWAVYGWLLWSEHAQIHKYRHFFFLTSMMKGPFLPAYLLNKLHWTQPFIRLLSRSVKLVSPTISCEGSARGDDQLDSTARVDENFVATDRAGLRMLMMSNKVFRCPGASSAHVHSSDMGASKTILSAGYNLGCLMVRYQGVDWQQSNSWDCNHRVSPQLEFSNDGITVSPLEVMFVRTTSYDMKYGWDAAVKARKYAAWRMAPSHNKSISSNQFLEELSRFKAPAIVELNRIGNVCFDHLYYQEHSEDLKGLQTDDALWFHYVHYGQFESRPHRFTCPINYKLLAAGG